jgi:enoyl-CoA hydratase
MTYNNLLFEKADGIGVLSFNRPKALNALNSETLKELETALGDIQADEEVKVLIVTGAGEKSFVAGADIAEMKDMTAVQGLEFARLGQKAIGTLQDISKPVIAAVNGFALGGGSEVALACDFIIASEKAKFGLPEVGLGLFPGFGGTQRLARLIGKAKAKEMIFTAKIIGGQEAFEMGIVNKVVAPEQLLDEAKAIAKAIASKGQVAVKLAKAVINSGFDMDIKNGCELEANTFGVLFNTEDQKEGCSAFVEKRPASFTGK